MLRFFLTLVLIHSFLYAQTIVSYGHTNKKQHYLYTIQILSTSKHISKEELLHTIVAPLRNHIYIFKVNDGKYMVAYYARASHIKNLSKILNKVKKIGYKDAYIIKIAPKQLKLMQNKNLKHNKKKTPKFSRYSISQLISKANNAYKSNDEQKAIIDYEMLLSAGVTNSKIKNNLCFLYGKYGSWDEAKDIIDKDKFPARFIYAYANAAVRTLQPNFYANLHNYIALDRTGHLAVLAGYYYEQLNRPIQALKFYKMAYEKNRSDIYNMYAYARFLDTLEQINKALPLYEKLYRSVHNESDISKAVTKRLQELRNQS